MTTSSKERELLQTKDQPISNILNKFFGQIHSPNEDSKQAEMKQKVQNYIQKDYHRKDPILNENMGDQKDSNVHYLQKQELPNSGVKKLPNIWKNVTNQYNLECIIGEGSYGVVARGTCKITGQAVAIKLVKDFSKWEYDCVKAIREIQLMRKLAQMQDQASFQCTPQLLDVILPKMKANSDKDMSVFIVMEVFGTSLKNLIELGEKSQLNKNHIMVIFYNCLLAIKFLHSANVIHRDIKPSNILVNENCHVRICDFGLARSLPKSCTGKGSGNSKRVRDAVHRYKLESSHSEQSIRNQITQKLLTINEQEKNKQRCLSSHVGSRWYRAPEICLLNNQYDQSSDIWSLACSLFEILQTYQQSQERKQNIAQNFESDVQTTLIRKKQNILFPGDSCYPISKKNKHRQDYNQNYVSQEDQMRVIVSRLNTKLNYQDILFVQKEESRDYIQQILIDKSKFCISQPEEQKQPSEGLNQFDFVTQLNEIDDQMLVLIEKMLQFNPYFRYCASECLSNPIFDQIKQQKSEISAPSKINLEVDQDEAFDYTGVKCNKYSKEDYCKMIIKEAYEVHQERLQFLEQFKNNNNNQKTDINCMNFLNFNEMQQKIKDACSPSKIKSNQH